MSERRRVGISRCLIPAKVNTSAFWLLQGAADNMLLSVGEGGSLFSVDNACPLQITAETCLDRDRCCRDRWEGGRSTDTREGNWWRQCRVRGDHVRRERREGSKEKRNGVRRKSEAAVGSRQHHKVEPREIGDITE